VYDVQEKALVAAATSTRTCAAAAGDNPGDCQQQHQQQRQQQHSGQESRGHKLQALSLPPQRSSNDFLLDAAVESPGLPSGERRVPPKCSDSGRQPSGEGSWSIPSSRMPQQQPQQPLTQQQHQQLGMAAQPAAANVSLASGAAAAPAAGGGSFAEVIAALRLEGSLQQLPSAVEDGGGCNAVQGSGDLPAAAAGSASDTGPSGSGVQRVAGIRQQQQRRQGTPRRLQQQQQQEAAPLPAFDPAQVERQLKAKLEQVRELPPASASGMAGAAGCVPPSHSPYAGGRHSEQQHAAWLAGWLVAGECCQAAQ
jgi:hypothetical protein